MNYQAALTRISSNSKTGPIPVSTTEASTCPPTCGQYNTCYAKYGHVSIHWKAINEGKRGKDWEDFCAEVKALPRRTLWRHNQAGDLPGNGTHIDSGAMHMLLDANAGKKGFTFTHYPLSFGNVELIEEANRRGFTVNISCDNLTEVDEVSNISDAPKTVVLHSKETRHALRTPGGQKVVVCPATYRDDMTCSRCQICADSSPGRATIGFPAHGSKKFTIDRALEAAT